MNALDKEIQDVEERLRRLRAARAEIDRVEWRRSFLAGESVCGPWMWSDQLPKNYHQGCLVPDGWDQRADQRFPVYLRGSRYLMQWRSTWTPGYDAHRAHKFLRRALRVRRVTWLYDPSDSLLSPQRKGAASYQECVAQANLRFPRQRQNFYPRFAHGKELRDGLWVDFSHWAVRAREDVLRTSACEAIEKGHAISVLARQYRRLEKMEQEVKGAAS